MNSRSSGYLEQLFDVLGPQRGLLAAIAMVGAAFPGPPRLLDFVWRAFTNRIREAGYGERPSMLDDCRDLGLFEPDRAIELAELALGAPPGEDPPIYGLLSRPPSRNDVVVAVPALLRSVVSRHPEYFAACGRLLWPLALGDERMLNSYPDHPLRVLREAASYQNGSVRALEVIVNSVADMVEGQGSDERRSVLEIIEPLLATTVDISYASLNSLIYETYRQIDPVATRGLRDRVISLFLSAAAGDNQSRALHAIRSLETIVKQAQHTGIADPESGGAYVRERDDVLDALARLIGNRSTVRDLQIANILRSHQGRIDIGPRIATIIAMVPDDREHRIFRAVVTDFQKRWGLHGSIQQHTAEIARVIDTTALELLDEAPDVALLLDRIVAIVQLATTANLSTNPSPLIAAVINIRPALASGLLDEAFRRGDAQMFPWLLPCLRKAWETDYANGFALSNRLLDLGDALAENAVLNGINHAQHTEPAHFDPALRQRIVERLLRSQSSSVREFAAMSASQHVTSETKGGASLILNADIDDPEALDTLFASMDSDDGSQVEGLRGEEFDGLLDKVRIAKRMGYGMCRFLAIAASRDADRVIETLLARVQTPPTRENRGFSAIPIEGLHGLGPALQKHGALTAALERLLHSDDRRGLDESLQAFGHLAQDNEACALTFSSVPRRPQT